MSGAWAKLIGLVLRLVSMLGVYGKGRSDAKTKAKIKGLENKIKAKEVSDDVDKIDDDAVPSELRKWLRKK